MVIQTKFERLKSKLPIYKMQEPKQNENGKEEIIQFEKEDSDQDEDEEDMLDEDEEIINKDKFILEMQKHFSLTPHDAKKGKVKKLCLN